MYISDHDVQLLQTEQAEKSLYRVTTGGQGMHIDTTRDLGAVIYAIRIATQSAGPGHALHKAEDQNYRYSLC